MRELRAINRTRNTILCERLEDAGGLRGQSRGLLGRENIADGKGMMFVNGRFNPFMWMHMFFMKFAIDIVFLDRDDRVIRIDRELRPWRVSSIVFGARKALELSAGAALRTGTIEGDVINFE
jgi:uncharacterized protein